MLGKNKQNKLTFLQEWCKVLQKEEWKKVSELADTSFVITNPKTIEVLAFFKKNKKIDIHKLVDITDFVQYSKIKMEKGDWKKINSQISAACRLYIQIKMSTDDIHSDLNMQKYYIENGMDKHLEKKKKDNKEVIMNSPVKNSYYGYYLSRWKEMELWDTKAKDARQKMIELDDWENAIEFFYHENKLRVLICRLNRASFKKSDAISSEQHLWVNNISDEIKTIPQVKYHAMLYDIFTNECDTTFDELWQMLKSENFVSLLDMDGYAYKLCLYLTAYSSHRINKGYSLFHERYIDITLFLESKGKLLEMGSIPATKLKNIIKSLLESQENSETAKAFLQKYKDFIPDTKNAMILEYCEALILFYEGKYSAAKQKLSPIASIKNKKGTEDLVKDDFAKIGIRYLYIMVLIGLSDFIEAEKLRKNLQEMLYNKDGHIAKKYAVNYKLGLYFIKKIVKAPLYKRDDYFECIIYEIDNESYFRDKKWIKAALVHRKKGGNKILPPKSALIVDQCSKSSGLP